MSKLPCRKRGLLTSITLLVCWEMGRMSPNFIFTTGSGSKDSTTVVALEDAFDAHLGRRTALVGAFSLAQPGLALAKRGGGEGGELATKQAIPETIETEEPISEDWQPVDIGESSVVDPDDPKYKQMRLMNDIEKQKAKNEEYNSMTSEEKQQKMCELLGRGCQNL